MEKQQNSNLQARIETTVSSERNLGLFQEKLANMCMKLIKAFFYFRSASKCKRLRGHQ